VLAPLLVLPLQHLRRAADHAPQRILDQDRADARGGLDPGGQAGQQRAPAGQPDLAPDDILGQARRDVGEHLVHRGGDRRHDGLQGGGHQPARHVLRPRRALPGIEADRLRPALGPAGHAQRHLELAGGALADDQPELGPDRLHDRLVHRVAGLAQRLGPHHAPARDGGDLGRPAADVDHEPARPAGQVEPGPGRGGHWLVDQPHVVPGAPDAQRGDDGPPFDRRGAAGHADQGVRPQRVARAPGPAQEVVQQGSGRVQVGDDPVPQRVDHLDVLWFLVGQRIGRLAYRGDLADGCIDGDRGGLFEHDAAPSHPDQRIDRAEINGHATPEAHVAPLCRHGQSPAA
jgi:hypothetical protein